MSKKVLSLVLVFMLVFSFLSVNSYATAGWQVVSYSGIISGITAVGNTGFVANMNPPYGTGGLHLYGFFGGWGYTECAGINVDVSVTVQSMGAYGDRYTCNVVVSDGGGSHPGQVVFIKTAW